MNRILGNGFHPRKYGTVSQDTRVGKALHDVGKNSSLITAAYANSSWKSMMAARNCLDRFCAVKNMPNIWPVPAATIQAFINWATFEKKNVSSHN